MEHLLDFYGISIDEIIISVLTLVIAISVLFQAKFTRDQAKLFKEAEDRQRLRDRPNVKLTTAMRSFSQGVDEAGNPRNIWFVGFQIANTSQFDITITNWCFDSGVKDSDNALSRHIAISPIVEFDGTKVSDVDFPHRLRYGETVRLLFRREELLEWLKRDGEDGQARVRAICQDSLANTYTMDHWVEWTEGGFAGHDGPGPGYRPSYLYSREGPQQKHPSRHVGFLRKDKTTPAR